MPGRAIFANSAPLKCIRKNGEIFDLILFQEKLVIIELHNGGKRGGAAQDAPDTLSDTFAIPD